MAFYMESVRNKRQGSVRSTKQDERDDGDDPLAGLNLSHRSTASRGSNHSVRSTASSTRIRNVGPPKPTSSVARELMADFSRVAITGRGSYPVYVETSLKHVDDPRILDFAFGQNKDHCPLEQLEWLELHIGTNPVIEFRKSEFIANVESQLSTDSDGSKLIHFHFSRIGVLTIAVHGWPQDQWEKYAGRKGGKEFVKELIDNVARSNPRGKTTSFVNLEVYAFLM